MPKVIFHMEDGGKRAALCQPGESLLELARREGIAIDAPCSGNGLCGKCRVRLESGSLEATPSRHIPEEEALEGWCLACDAKVTQDCTVFIPARFQKLQTLDLSGRREQEALEDSREQLKKCGISFENSFVALSIVMDAPTQDDPTPDAQRLTQAIGKKLGVREVKIPCSVMARLAQILRANGFTVCVKGERKEDAFRVMDVCKPGDRALVGCALDVGTTTVAAALMDLTSGRLLSAASCANAQIRYGADVINRIICQGQPGGKETLQDAILRQTLNPLLSQVCRNAGVSGESILRLCVAANTTMNHLLVGADAQGIRTEPYVPSFFRWDGLLARELGLEVNPEAAVLLAPNIGSYVGGDITAGTLVSGIWNREETTLFIDLGTNGEIVLGNREFLIGCACSAGPAFEGGGISCGMRSAPGAVERVALNDDMELTLTVIGSQRPVGLCGSGLIDLVAELFRTGVINPRGQIVGEGSRIRREKGMASYILAHPWESGTGREVSLTEADIDSFIRAKGAVYSAIDTMLRYVDLTPDGIDRILVAGGIGSGMDMEKAVRVGMLPNVDRKKFRYIGNTSLAGAYAMAMSDPAYETCCHVAEGITYLELSTCPGYMDSFVAACFLPHTDAGLFDNRK